MSADLLLRRQDKFVLWGVVTKPQLVIGQLQPGNPGAITGVQTFNLTLVQGFPDLWEIPASQCKLTQGQTYHYWFKVADTNPKRNQGQSICITDPAAYLVDWRVLAPRNPAPFNDNERHPAAVVLWDGSKLVAPDIAGQPTYVADKATLEKLPANNRLVIYEMPTTWARSAEVGGRDMGVGSFCDVLALFDTACAGANFDELDVTQVGRAYLRDLGVNALELLPPADSIYNRQWGYGTTNYLAPDFELGFPYNYASPAPNRDLLALVRACHTYGVRIFVDAVLAFSKTNPYLTAACDDFFLLDPENNLNDPDTHNSRYPVATSDENTRRNPYGASLWRYARFKNGYDPLSGLNGNICPARAYLLTALMRWMKDFQINGLRLDSVENVQNWEFIQQYSSLARTVNSQRFQAQNANGADERFLTVGEELWEPKDLLTQNRLDGLWHGQFKYYIRKALLGWSHESAGSHAETVRRALDCRSFGYTDLTQAVIYLTSHDVQGEDDGRLYNYLVYNGCYETEKRIKLAHVCLLTAVGLPMILAGEEFADEHDNFDANHKVTHESGKQVDPVNYSRLGYDWRGRIKDYVTELIKLRTSHEALCRNDIEFIHEDYTKGRRILAWRRGLQGSNSQVVVVANFSDYATPNPLDPASSYRVHKPPVTPGNAQWRVINQNRTVPAYAVGNEPIFPWEAKVYALP